MYEMFHLLIFGLLLTTTSAYPLTDEVSIDDHRMKETDELKQILNDVSYVTTFKNMMADYVKSQYTDLTVQDMETIQEHLEEFCHAFAKDLKYIVENADSPMEMERVEDGLPDSTFDSVKSCIKNELPSIEDGTADRVTNALRGNLLVARRKIDAVIRASQRAAAVNA